METEYTETVQTALAAFAKAIALTSGIFDMKNPGASELYFAREFLPEMESLFIEQVVTCIPTHLERRKLLRKVKLEYLYEQMKTLEREWNRL